MPLYVYETTDKGPRRVFELRQSMKDEPLREDPETGRPVRRVISGGLEMPRGKCDSARAPSCAAPHGNSCSCCNPM